MPEGIVRPPKRLLSLEMHFHKLNSIIFQGEALAAALSFIPLAIRLPTS